MCGDNDIEGSGSRRVAIAIHGVYHDFCGKRSVIRMDRGSVAIERDCFDIKIDP